VDVEDRTTEPMPVQALMTGPGLLEVLGVATVAGRTFSAADARPGAPRVAVVSERFALHAWGGAPATGRRIRWAQGDRAAPAPWMEVVGVVPDIGLDPGNRTTRGEVFYPLIGTDFMYVALRTAAPPAALSVSVRRAIAEVDARIRVTDEQPLADVGWETRATLAGGAGVLTTLGILALVLSLAAVYALASLAVTSRMREIGVRLALGATRTQILRPLFTRTALQLAGGALAGSGLAVLANLALAALPFSVPGSVGVLVPLAVVALVGAGILATWIPARRALRITPVDALKTE
jgi:hypothetical protein